MDQVRQSHLGLQEVSSMTPRTKALADEYCEFGALPSSPLQGATEEQLQEDV